MIAEIEGVLSSFVILIDLTIFTIFRCMLTLCTPNRRYWAITLIAAWALYYLHKVTLWNKFNQQQQRIWSNVSYSVITTLIYHPFGYERGICHFAKWQIHPFISNRTICLYKPQRSSVFIQFVLVFCSSSIWILKLWVYGYYNCLILSVRGLTLDVRIWRL